MTYFCILDFEATCFEQKGNYEIIEFPSILYKLEEPNSLIKIDEFQEYIKPIHNKISPFCTDLTGITPEMVDKSDNFPTVLTRHYHWLKKHLGNHIKDVIFVTCGGWDLNAMLPVDIIRWNIVNIPEIYKTFVNMKKVYAKVYNLDNPKGMASMLEHANLPLDGRHHSGIDDCRNISKLWIKIINDGYLDWDSDKTVVLHIIKKKFREGKKQGLSLDF
jgi:ERI1 exoribonuclease 3